MVGQPDGSLFFMTLAVLQGKVGIQAKRCKSYGGERKHLFSEMSAFPMSNCLESRGLWCGLMVVQVTYLLEGRSLRHLVDIDSVTSRLNSIWENQEDL